MGTYESVANALRKHWNDNVATSGLSLATIYENVFTNPPDSDPFAMVQVRFDSRDPSTAVGDGKGRPRVSGALAAQLYYPSDEGESAAWAASDTIVDLFDGLTLTGDPATVVIHFSSTSARSLGQDQGRMRVDISAPFFSDDEG